MKSICIKTISKEIIEDLISQLESVDANICISNYRFKTYDNLTIHYLDKENTNEFYEIISTVLRKTIENFYDEGIIEKYIKKNYFYLGVIEKNYILEIAKKVLELPENNIGYKRGLLKKLINDYLIDNNKIVLEGFINFRIKEYKELLGKIVEVSVFSYLDLVTF